MGTPCCQVTRFDTKLFQRALQSLGIQTLAARLRRSPVTIAAKAAGLRKGDRIMLYNALRWAEALGVPLSAIEANDNRLELHRIKRLERIQAANKKAALAAQGTTVGGASDVFACDQAAHQVSRPAVSDKNTTQADTD